MRYEVRMVDGIGAESTSYIDAEFVDVLGDVVVFARRRRTKPSEEDEFKGAVETGDEQPPLQLLPPEIVFAIPVKYLVSVTGTATASGTTVN